MGGAEAEIRKYLRLIAKEYEEERSQNLREIFTLSGPERQRKGRCILEVVRGRTELSVGLSHFVHFHATPRSIDFLDTQMREGTVVLVTPKGRKVDPETSREGTVVEVSRRRLVVEFKGLDTGSGRRGDLYRIDLYASATTYEREKTGLLTLLHGRSPRYERLKEVVFGDYSPPEVEPEGSVEFVNEKLDERKREVLRHLLAVPDFGLIFGPPGTGKTYTSAELIVQMVRRGKRVLASAHSNVAVDNLTEKLAGYGVDVVRVGHFSRVSRAVRECSLYERLRRDPRYREVERLKEKAVECFKIRDSFPKPTRERVRGLSYKQISRAVRERRRMRGIPYSSLQKYYQWMLYHRRGDRLLERALEVEERIVEDVLSSAQVVCATTTVCAQTEVASQEFDVVLVDEGSQATVPATLLPLLLGDRFYIAGDHKQLPPTVFSLEAKREGLEKSLFELLMERYPERGWMLHVQYRMNDEIAEFSNRKFYSSRLITPPEVARRALSDVAPSLPSESPFPHLFDDSPVVFYEVSGGESKLKDSPSRMNVAEGLTVALLVGYLVANGVRGEDVGVIAPYRDQVEFLRRAVIFPEVEVHTVDGFQGREKEVVVLSLVRSNEEGELGFLVDERRLNVSLTRAKRKLIVVGDPSTLSAHPLYSDLVEWLRSKARAEVVAAVRLAEAVMTGCSGLCS